MMNTADNFLDVFGGTCIGLTRKQNQDSVLVLKQQRLFAVADGMGGGYDGASASRICVSSLEENIRNAEQTPAAREDAVIRAAYKASKAIIGKKPKEYDFSGTTLACMLFNPWTPNAAMIAYAGDSRVYRIHKDNIVSLTKDHIGANLTNGKVAPDNLECLTNFIGRENDFFLERSYAVIQENDYFIICTDGLHKMVPDHEIAEICLRYKTEGVEIICRQLISQALWHGGKDNISSIVIKINQLPVPYEPTEEELETDNKFQFQNLHNLAASSIENP